MSGRLNLAKTKNPNDPLFRIESISLVVGMIISQIILTKFFPINFQICENLVKNV